jgi:catechol 2,3-dioxygenase-like lactoylglutathione lyase family enzyme
MALKRMDNVGIVVDDLGGTIDFFRELGLELEKGGPRSKENGPDVSLDLPISASRLP